MAAVTVTKLATGIAGFDQIARGGLPRGRVTLLEGAVGTGKTVFACQVLAGGIADHGEAAVFIACDEPPAEVRRNALGLGWDIAAWEMGGQWAFVDCTGEPGRETVVAGAFDLGALLARVEYAVRRTGAQRLALDSLDGLFAGLGDGHAPRQEVVRLLAGFRALGVTSVVACRPDAGSLVRMAGPAADNLVRLAAARGGHSIEIVKFRGAPHQKGAHTVVVHAGEGMAVLAPRSVDSRHVQRGDRVASGNPVLDRMAGGGILPDSLILVAGPPGLGKTLLATEFLAGGAGLGERCLAFSFNESRARWVRNAAAWGIDVEKMEADRRLAIVAAAPQGARPDEHLLMLQALIDRFEPRRVVVDSLSSLRGAATRRGYQAFAAQLVALLREKGVIGLVTAAAPAAGPWHPWDLALASSADMVVLMRYLEAEGEFQRAVAVLKQRASWHEHGYRAFTVDDTGMHIGRPVRDAGALAGEGQAAAWEETLAAHEPRGVPGR